MPLLVNANLEEVAPHLGWIFDGPFNDFIPLWYRAVGYTVTQTMIINALMPVFVHMIVSLIAWLKRKSDKRCKSNEYDTKTTQINQYLDIYLGPEFIIHFKYSNILNVTFVTMMYGVGIPILFPIACLNFSILWMLERYQIAYTF